MARFHVLTKTVLGLAMFVCQPTQSLETGYKYPGNVSVEKDVLCYDLKCTYMFSGLTHMMATKQLFRQQRLSMVIGKIIPYNVTKNQIHSLYHLKVTRMGALWVQYLYLAMLSEFYHKSSNKEEDGQKIIATHNYVIAQLRKDLTDCRKDNSFNNEWKIIITNGKPPKEYLMTLISNNITEAIGLLAKNNISNQPPDGKVVSALQIGSLFLNNIGSKDEFIGDLMDAFNVQVDWSSTGERLSKSWGDAHVLYWPIFFENLKLYYKLIFNFLKIIMLRLTAKHLKYLEPFFGTDLYVRYAEEWYKKVQQFGDMLSLTEDLHVKDLLASLDNLVKKEKTIGCVVDHLNPILETLCQPLGCDATKEFELNGEEFGKTFKNTIKKNGFKIKESPMDIEHYSLENTRAFLTYLSWVFRYSDFNLIQLLIKYINEVKP